ncbi:MAG: LUD domain-containing protein, partial [Candidatus Binataceae bacterium]
MAAATNPRAFFKTSALATADLELRRKLDNATSRHLDHVNQARDEFPAYDDERDAARRIKDDSIRRIDELLVELTQNLEQRGAHVFFAVNAAQARDYIISVAKRSGARRVVKGKSMTTEEIELNQALGREGIDAVETDLGEYIVQLRGERPSHIITPAIHLSKEDIGGLFHEKLGIPYTAEPEELTLAARDRLRQIFLAADLGITGVNFAIAETGTLVMVENEGNGRMSNTLPETFIAVMGLEKVIPKLADLSHFLEILARAGTGQKLTTYTNFISGPRRRGELDGPREMHVVILDNGRSEMLADPVLREALACIRCGACLNVCPVYRQIGGHAYN